MAFPKQNLSQTLCSLMSHRWTLVALEKKLALLAVQCKLWWVHKEI